jgi:hypothetical protein
VEDSVFIQPVNGSFFYHVGGGLLLHPIGAGLLLLLERSSLTPLAGSSSFAIQVEDTSFILLLEGSYFTTLHPLDGGRYFTHWRRVAPSSYDPHSGTEQLPQDIGAGRVSQAGTGAEELFHLTDAG